MPTEIRTVSRGRSPFYSKDVGGKKAAQDLQFERAAILRDEIVQLKKLRIK